MPAGGSARARPRSSPACAAALSAALPIAACVILASDGVGWGPISSGPEQSAHSPAASAARWAGTGTESSRAARGLAAPPRAQGTAGCTRCHPKREVSPLPHNHLLSPGPARSPPAPAAQPILKQHGLELLRLAQCCQGLDPRVTHPWYQPPTLQLAPHPRHCQTQLLGTSLLHGQRHSPSITSLILCISVLQTGSKAGDGLPLQPQPSHIPARGLSSMGRANPSSRTGTLPPHTHKPREPSSPLENCCPSPRPGSMSREAGSSAPRPPAVLT